MGFEDFAKILQAKFKLERQSIHEFNILQEIDRQFQIAIEHFVEIQSSDLFNCHVASIINE